MNLFNRVYSFIACLFLILTQPLMANGQDFVEVDFKTLETEIRNSASKFYYPKLMERYRLNDSTLTKEDYRNLYYGFTFHSNYKPEQRADLVYKLDSYLPSPENSKEEFAQLKSACDSILTIEPFNLRAINYLMQYSQAHEDISVHQSRINHYSGLLNAIMSSGNGRTEDSGFVVNYSEDKYLLLAAFGFLHRDLEAKGSIDYHLIQANDAGVEGVYFDTARMRDIGAKQFGLDVIEIEEEEIPDGGVQLGSADEINGYIPLGFSVIDQQSADVNGDGSPDWLVILQKEGEQFISAGIENPSLRPFLVLLRGNDGIIDRVLQNDNIVLCIDCGEGSEDPLMGLTVNEDSFTISQKGGSSWQWERSLTFGMNPSNELVLVEDKNVSYRRSKPDKKNEIVETSEDFGVVYFKDFSSYEDLR